MVTKQKSISWTFAQFAQWYEGQTDIEQVVKYLLGDDAVFKLVDGEFIFATEQEIRDLIADTTPLTILQKFTGQDFEITLNNGWAVLTLDDCFDEIGMELDSVMEARQQYINDQWAD